MCGIFGLVITPKTSLSTSQILSIVKDLFKSSESRGREAAGVSIAGTDSLKIFKRAQPATQMIKTDAYRNFIANGVAENLNKIGFSVIGHSRLVTNGSHGVEENNQPVATNNCVGVHNGIIVNDNVLWERNLDLSRTTNLDSEVIYRLLDKYYSKEQSNLAQAIKKVYLEIEGEANIAFFHSIERVLSLATNVGSLYYAFIQEAGVFVFASERHFLHGILRKNFKVGKTLSNEIIKLNPNQAMIVDFSDLSSYIFGLSDNPAIEYRAKQDSIRMITDDSPKRPKLVRCTKCILPHTFPYINFDTKGICNYCREPLAENKDNRETLETLSTKVRRNDGRADCIVALSGGRDSCYGLHVIKRELGLNPIAYTYDWAMVTDQARRNCARICGELEVEHIIRSADITSKRRNIRLNIEAWMKQPQLGMIPLFMAGDKQFFHYASQVSKETDIPLVIFCGGNNLEITRFKTGFCGVNDKSNHTMVGLDFVGKLKLLAYYAKNFLLNPHYLNRSVIDTLFAFYSTYVNRQDFLYLYRYVEWNEEVIANTLTKHYGWESSGDSASTWRIGDGTAAFYNYIYHTVAGFSEHDTFRSNQIRQGLINRDQALAYVEMENKPRYAAMQEYANLVGFSLDEALVVINNIPKIS